MGQSKRNKVNIDEASIQSSITAHGIHLRAVLRFTVINENKLWEKHTSISNGNLQNQKELAWSYKYFKQ